MPGPLGRIAAPDDLHIRKYSLTAETMPTTPTPVVLGINWYSAFDDPWRDSSGKYWITQQPSAQFGWGSIRGGHAICVKPPGVVDSDGWWAFYKQEFARCCGYASSRMMTLLNHRRYDGDKLYRDACAVDEFSENDGNDEAALNFGTTVRAAMDILRNQGPYRVNTDYPYQPDGISANRWATSVEEIAACLSPVDAGKKVLDRGYVELLNSWGKEGYPHIVRLPLEALRRLIFDEQGDATVVTDR